MYRVEDKKLEEQYSELSNPKQVAVRPVLENQYGISGDRINYADGKVTLDGKGILTPTGVSNGVSYVNEPSIIHNAFTQVRPAMNAYGISDDRIGYSNGHVTLDGKDFLKPDTIGSDNRSYVTGKKVAEAISNYGAKNNILPAKSYIEGKNLGVTVGWDANTGEVLVGSTRLKPDYISQDGRAQVSKSRLDEAIAREKENMGIYSGWDILDRTDRRYGDRIDKLYDRVNDRGSFSYDVSKDPVYQAFAEQWASDVNSAYDDTIAKLNSQSGGAPSLGALSAAWNLRGKAMDQLAGYQNQFREQAYQKWADEYARDVQNLETALAMRDNEFAREYGVNRDALADKRYDASWIRDLITRGLTDEKIAQEMRFAEEEQPYRINAYEHAEALYPYETGQAEANLVQTETQTDILKNEEERAQQLHTYNLIAAALQNEAAKVGIKLDEAQLAKLYNQVVRTTAPYGGLGSLHDGNESKQELPAISTQWLPWYLQ